jgi:hypothetical protein
MECSDGGADGPNNVFASIMPGSLSDRLSRVVKAFAANLLD